VSPDNSHSNFQRCAGNDGEKNRCDRGNVKRRWRIYIYSRFAPGDGGEAGRKARGPHVGVGIKAGLRTQQQQEDEEEEEEPNVSKQPISLPCYNVAKLTAECADTAGLVVRRAVPRGSSVAYIWKVWFSLKGLGYTLHIKR